MWRRRSAAMLAMSAAAAALAGAACATTTSTAAPPGGEEATTAALGNAPPQPAVAPLRIAVVAPFGADGRVGEELARGARLAIPASARGAREVIELEVDEVGGPEALRGVLEARGAVAAILAPPSTWDAAAIGADAPVIVADASQVADVAALTTVVVDPDEARRTAPAMAQLARERGWTVAIVSHEHATWAAVHASLDTLLHGPSGFVIHSFRQTGQAATTVSQLAVDGVLVLAGPTTTAVLVRRLRHLRVAAPIVGGPWWDDPYLDDLGDQTYDAGDVSYVTGFAREEPAASAFVRAYEQRHGERATGTAAHGWDATGILLDALPAVGLGIDVDVAQARDELREALARVADRTMAGGALVDRRNESMALIAFTPEGRRLIERRRVTLP